MSTWAKILVEGDNTNIGNSNLGTPASTARVLKVGSSGSFKIQDSDSADSFKVTKTSCFLGGPSSTNTSLVSGNTGTEGAKFEVTTSGAQTSSAALYKCNSLRVQNHSNTATSASKLYLERIPADGNGLSSGEAVGTIFFDGQVDQTLVNAQADVISFSNITGKAVSTGLTLLPTAPPTFDYDLEGKLEFSVRNGDGDFLAAEITADGDAASNNASTANEQKLKSLKLGGTSLETLTRRNIITFQVGENGDITHTLDGPDTNHALRMANGVQSVLDTTLASSLGIVAPFSGYIIGGTFQFRYESGTQADVEMFVRRIHGVGYQDIRVAHVQNAQDDDDFYRSTTYPITGTNHRSSSFVVAAGDVLVPYIKLSSDSGTYELSDVVGQFFLYTEEVI